MTGCPVANDHDKYCPDDYICDTCPHYLEAVEALKSKAPSGQAEFDLLYSQSDMVCFASFFYGPDIDLLDGDAQFECKSIEGALKYWAENIRGKAV